jgi:opacity protein-like surface antigen
MNHTRLFAALACTLHLLAAHAGRPMATEDAGLLERGDCEWESYAGRATKRQSSAVKTLSTQLGCGIGIKSQVALAVQRETSDGQRTSALVLGGKTSLIERKDNGPGLTLAWGAAAVKQPGEKMKHERTALNLVLSQELAQALTGHANLGVTRSQGTKKTSRTWNVAAEYALGGGVDVMAEYYGAQQDKPAAAAGVRYAVTDKFNVDASYSVQSGAGKAKLVTVGAKLAF